MKHLLWTFLLIITLSTLTTASHLVGGELNYECLGNNNYEFTLKVYRDCGSVNPQGTLTSFDNLSSIAIYSVANGSYTLVQSVNVPIDTQYNIEASSLVSTCLIPPNNFCIDVGIYQTIYQLPYNAEGYVVSYQRCCRNANIVNISNPEQTGTTHTVFLSDLAQTSCNNPPQFNTIPPTILCIDNQISINSSATDAEGDSLVYSFCSPLNGAMIMNPAPNPADPPPYAPISYASPYSATNPIISNPQITINSQTGIITGKASAIGAYAVGVCIEEYRNDTLLSSTARDIVVYVVNCTPILSTIQTDSLGVLDTLLFDNCSTNFQLLSNPLFWGNNNIFNWQFSTVNFILTDTATYPNFIFPADGTFQGNLSITGLGCTDTIPAIFTVHSLPQPNFSFSIDSILADSVRFTNLSTSLTPLSYWHWDFGTGDTSGVYDPAYLYSDTGTYQITLILIDDNGCENDTMITVPYYPNQLVSNQEIIQKIGAKIYPNPATDQFYLELKEYSNSNNLTIQIYNILGQQVFEQKNWNRTILSVNVKNWNKGMYFITILNDGRALKVLQLAVE